MFKKIPASSWFALAFLLIIVMQASAQTTSTPEERTHWAEITHKLENDPLNADVNNEGEKALQRVMEVKDFHVPLCPAFFGDFNTMKYAYAHAITRQFMLATAAFLIENPGKQDDRNTMNTTAIESVLKTYSSILQQKPDAKSKLLDDLLQRQKQGKLTEYIQKRCS